MAKPPIHIKPENKGKLHKTAGVPADQPIPMAKLQELKNSPNPTTRKRANFAINARKFKHD